MIFRFLFLDVQVEIMYSMNLLRGTVSEKLSTRDFSHVTWILADGKLRQPISKVIIALLQNFLIFLNTHLVVLSHHTTQDAFNVQEGQAMGHR